MIAAQKTDWQTQSFSQMTKELPYQRDFSSREFAKIKMGFIPKVMEDKWFIYFENDTLNFHRSWTGYQIYQLSLLLSDSRTVVTKTIVNADSSEYNRDDNAYDIKLLNYLIDSFLLGKNVKFE